MFAQFNMVHYKPSLFPTKVEIEALQYEHLEGVVVAVSVAVRAADAGYDESEERCEERLLVLTTL